MCNRAGKSPKGLSVFWPIDDPTEEEIEDPVVVPYGRINGCPINVHLWSERPDDDDARYVPSIRSWLALRIG